MIFTTIMNKSQTYHRVSKQQRKLFQVFFRIPTVLIKVKSGHLQIAIFCNSFFKNDRLYIKVLCVFFNYV